MLPTFAALSLISLSPLALTIAECQELPADLVVINAKVHTMTSRSQTAEAFAVSKNLITAVGKNSDIKRRIGSTTRVIDAGGRLVLPGFNDSHVHFMAIGNTFSSIDLKYVTTAAEMTKRIANHARFLPKGRWILGGHFKADSSWLPDRNAVDDLTPDTPIFLYRSDVTTAFANTLAFKLAKLSVESPGVDRDAAGNPTGIIRGAALQKIASIVPRDHTTNWPEIAETATTYAASLGVTSVQDMHSDDSREVYLDLERRGRLKTRVYDCVPLRNWKLLEDTRLKSVPGAMVADGCLKSFSDGEDESKPALLRDVIAADKAGLQVMIHAIGNRANKVVLDVFEQTAKTNPGRDRRFRIEHAHNAAEEDLQRFKRANVTASMQPFLFEGSNGSRYGSLLRDNATVAFGSDASMVELNPLLGIHAAVNANDGQGIGVYEAVRAYTVTSSYAEFKEKQKGTIAVGMLADFVFLSDDIFTIDKSKIADVAVLLTAVDGRVVFDRLAIRNEITR